MIASTTTEGYLLLALKRLGRKDASKNGPCISKARNAGTWRRHQNFFITFSMRVQNDFSASHYSGQRINCSKSMILDQLVRGDVEDQEMENARLREILRPLSKEQLSSNEN